MPVEYRAVTATKTFEENALWNTDGAHQYSIFNAGNTNVTIDAITVIKPRETWEGPKASHPKMGFFNKHTIEFDRANAPIIKTPVGGSNPPSTVVNPGDPVPVDNRVIIFFTKVE
jgi:hypothetical protein